MSNALTTDEQHVMIHALGLRTNSGMRRWAYRNRFVTNNKTEDFSIWEKLLARGYAAKNRYEDAPDWAYYEVTETGIQALGDNVLKRVPRELRIK